MGKNDDKQLQVALVTNADEMLWALKSSKDMDMEIRSHFSVELMDMWEAQTHRSMRGNCTEPVPKELIRHLDGPDLLRMKPGQCLLVTDQPVLLPMEIYETPIWIDNMYIRVGSQASLKNPGGLTLLDATKMYLTNVTIQGDGTTDSRASDGQYASIFGKTRTFYARDITIANLCGWTYNKWSQGPALAFTSSKSYANITNAQFLNNACPKGTPPSNPRYPQMHTGGLEVDHGYLWDPTDAPRLNDQNADDLFGAPVYYADHSMPIACPHCGETSSDVDDGMWGWPMAGPAPPEWDNGIESDVAASLNPNGAKQPGLYC